MGPYRIELATSDDDAALRAVLAGTPMPGAISVAFEREPSFFAARAVEGPFSQTLVVRDGRGEVAGVASRSICSRHVNGHPMPIGYLGSLRLVPGHRGRGLLARGFRFLRTLHGDGRTPMYLTTVAEDNEIALAQLTSGRAGLPAYCPMGRFHTMAIPVGKLGPGIAAAHAASVRAASESDLPALIEFLNRIGPRRQFFPCLREEDFRGNGRFTDLALHDILLAMRDGRIVGTLAGWDQRRFRQDVIRGYAQPWRTLRPLYNLWARLRGTPRLPTAGSVLRCILAALPVAQDDDHNVFHELLRALLQRCAGRDYDYLMLGLHESDPLLPALAGFRARRYTTNLYAVYLDEPQLLRRLDDRPPYLELGAL